MSNIYSADLLQTLPSVLNSDETYHQLASVVATQLHKLAEESDKATIYARIEQMPEALLDCLAHDFKIDWWDPDATLEEKRVSLKSSWYIHQHLGTRSAVEQVLTDYFGGGIVKEWPEYNGQPFHFQVESGNNTLIVENYAEFLRVLGIVKRASAVLDHVISDLEHQSNLYVGMAMQIGKTVSYEMNPVVTTGS